MTLLYLHSKLLCATTLIYFKGAESVHLVVEKCDIAVVTHVSKLQLMYRTFTRAIPRRFDSSTVPAFLRYQVSGKIIAQPEVVVDIS